jgi:hypothetical protein
VKLLVLPKLSLNFTDDAQPRKSLVTETAAEEEEG